MINYYLKTKTKELKSIPPSIDNIKESKKILFSIFTRYGDTIIDLVIIKEFIEQYSDKEYLIICPKQMKPYVTEILPTIRCLAFNKRNPVELFKVVGILKKTAFDIGFNPWSNGLDSSYFLSFCKKFLLYQNFKKPKAINHYQVVRKYLKLPEKDWSIDNLILKDNYKTILICPQSTDLNRSLNNDLLDNIIQQFKKDYNSPKIIIASIDKSFFRNSTNNFFFEKTSKSSENFLDLAKRSDLMVCVDSGPLHIALAIQKDLLAYMRNTSPKIVVNSGSSLVVNKY